MATATKQDDDLLIITDDDSSADTTGDIEFSFDAETPSSHAENDAGEIGENTQNTSESQSSEGGGNVKSESLDISFDLDEVADKKDTTNPEVTQSNETEDFSFDLTQENQAGEVEEKQNETFEDVDNSLSSEPSNSMNDILTATITKLSARKKTIASDKSQKTTKEDELKAQIKQLQDQVQQLEDEMKAQDSESEKITANIQQLEDMKLNPVKDHNAKRAKK